MNAELLTEKDDAELLFFLNRTFTAAHGAHDFLRLLPKLYLSGMREARHFAVRAGGEIAAAAGLYPVPLLVGQSAIRAAGIGAVATANAYEGRGLMGETVNAAVRYAREAGYDALFLSGERMRYQPFGFRPGGLSYAFTLTGKSRRALPPCGARLSEIDAGDAASLDACLALYRNNLQRAGRTAENFYETACSWNRRPYAVTENGAFLGYAIADEKRRVVAEFDAVDAAALKEVLYALAERETEVRVPPFREETVRAVAVCAENWRAECSDSFLTLNETRVRQAFQGYPYPANPLFGVETPFYLFEQDKV